MDREREHCTARSSGIIAMRLAPNRKVCRLGTSILDGSAVRRLFDTSRLVRLGRTMTGPAFALSQSISLPSNTVGTATTSSSVNRPIALPLKSTSRTAMGRYSSIATRIPFPLPLRSRIVRLSSRLRPEDHGSGSARQHRRARKLRREMNLAIRSSKPLALPLSLLLVLSSLSDTSRLVMSSSP